MDAHYESQKANLNGSGAAPAQTISGQARQMETGVGVGEFALQTGGLAILVLRKFILPVAGKMGTNLLEATTPEFGHVLARNEKPKCEKLISIAEKTAISFFAKNSNFLHYHNNGFNNNQPYGGLAYCWRERWHARVGCLGAAGAQVGSVQNAATQASCP